MLYISRWQIRIYDVFLMQVHAAWQGLQNTLFGVFVSKPTHYSISETIKKRRKAWNDQSRKINVYLQTSAPILYTHASLGHKESESGQADFQQNLFPFRDRGAAAEFGLHLFPFRDRGAVNLNVFTLQKSGQWTSVWIFPILGRRSQMF